MCGPGFGAPVAAKLPRHGGPLPAEAVLLQEFERASRLRALAEPRRAQGFNV